MKMQKTVSGDWAKKGEDIKDGDIITINNGGEVVAGDFGDRHVFKVETKNGEKLLSFNKGTINNLIEAYGEESESWVGKRAQVFLVRAMVSGKMQSVVYLAGEGWMMSDDGQFFPPKSPVAQAAASLNEIPVINTEVKGDDGGTVPF